MERINDLNQLKELSKNKVINCRIKVNVGMFGKLDIVKEIKYIPSGDTWEVFNNEKGIFENFNKRELKENTCIIEAINKGGLYLE